MNPYREVDVQARREAAIREARRVRDALDGSPRRPWRDRFYCVARHPVTRQCLIGSSQEIIDAIDGCLRELESERSP